MDDRTQRMITALEHVASGDTECTQLLARDAASRLRELAASNKALQAECDYIRHHFHATEEEGCLLWMNCDNNTLAEYERLCDATDAAKGTTP